MRKLGHPCTCITESSQRPDYEHLCSSSLKRVQTGQSCHYLERGGQRREREEDLPKSWEPSKQLWKATVQAQDPFGSSIRLLKEGFLPAPSPPHLKTPWGSPYVHKGPLPTHRVSLGFWRHSFPLLQLAHTCPPCWLCCRVSNSKV